MNRREMLKTTAAGLVASNLLPKAQAKSPKRRECLLTIRSKLENVNREVSFYKDEMLPLSPSAFSILNKIDDYKFLEIQYLKQGDPDWMRNWKEEEECLDRFNDLLTNIPARDLYWNYWLRTVEGLTYFNFLLIGDVDKSRIFPFNAFYGENKIRFVLNGGKYSGTYCSSYSADTDLGILQHYQYFWEDLNRKSLGKIKS